MKTEIRCGRCGQRYLVDATRIPRGGLTRACRGCGAPIVITCSVEPSEAGPASSDPPPTSAPKQVICPRCGLHFAAEGGKAAGEGSARPRVLVLEDMEFFQEVARNALDPTCEVVLARTLDEARRALAGGGIDLLMLDLALGDGEDGRQLLAELTVKPCPILIFTAFDEADLYGEAWEELRAAGADDVVIKGIQMGESLARKVATLLAGTGAERPAP